MAYAVIGSIFCFFDMVAYIFTLGPLWTLINSFRTAPKIVNVNGKEDSARRRDYCVSGLLESPNPNENVTTLTDVLLNSARKFADRPCFGTRDYLGELTEADPAKGQRFKPKHFGATTWLTYSQVEERVKCFGAGLRNLGMEAQPDPSKLNHFDDATGNFALCIYENTCADWLTACQGAFSQSMVTATVYATMGLDSLKDIVNECAGYALLCNRCNMSAVCKMAASMPSLKVLIYSNDMIKKDERATKPEALLQEFQAQHGDKIRVLSVDDVIQLGKEKPVAMTKPTKESMAVIMYTSGSTGKPKGVLIKHKQLLGMVAGLKDHVSRHGNANFKEGQEVFAAFLPTAHILELAAEHLMLAMGFAIGYADPRTLTPSGAEPKGALEEFRPTTMAGVPKIWDIIKKGAEAKAHAAGGLKAYLFTLAVWWKIRSQRWGMGTPLFEALVFSKIKAITGGRLRVAISGGGPLDKEVQNFIGATITPLIQGYGLTETCGGGTVQVAGDLRTGIVGPPLGSTEIRLVDALTEDNSGPLKDVKGNPYRVSDKFNVHGEACRGRGEVYIGGPPVAEGYYKNPKLTAESFVTVEGGRYMVTGDVGEWTPDGALKIVDRKKNLVKLKGGEYVALEHMESKLSNSVFVDALAGGVMVYAGGDVDRPVAFVQCAKKAITDWAAEQKLTLSYEELLSNGTARKAVLDDLNRCGKAGGLGDLEKLANVMLLNGGMGTGPDAWTPVNGGLTATNKINRRQAFVLLGNDRLNQTKTPFKI